MGAEDRRKTGSIHHVSGREVDVGGEGLIFVESEFLTSKDEYFSITLRSGVQKCGRALKRIVLCVVLAVGLPPPTSTSRPPDVIHMMNAPRPSPFLNFPIPCSIVNTNQRSKWERPGTEARRL